ncbi:protein kinase [Kitasatospora sp. NBC_01287]|uniref:protein kinase domain-containing protein n=1 Tax=Kitasatospora sp. NBC_01287 TaxID=2903573 RepID=UPI002259632C|nr:protein kinase [Kitasatospora sp. NBC_01287]MCX4751538.1 protein kinase [Kitasatospora sp. NBC_01287]
MEPEQVLGGRYVLSGLVGRGGMAEVYLARDRRLNRLVAVKLLRPDLAVDPVSAARFRGEVLAAASLNHPSIVAVFDSGEEWSGGAAPEGALRYLVMEYVQGRTLDELVREGGPMAAARALELTLGVLDALACAHAQGLVHRDVKPANVMVTEDGRTKVMDFGIARSLRADAMNLTQSAMVMGTAAYLSPEQARGEAVDGRSDLYATGCLLYELLTGTPPFTGATAVEVAWQQVNDEPRPPSELAPDLAPGCDALVLRALAKDREQRFQTAAEMRSALARALTDLTAATEPTAEVLGPAGPQAVGPQAVGPHPAGSRPGGRGRGRVRGAVLALVICAAGCAAAAGYAASGSAAAARTVRTPDLVGKSVADARQGAQGAGLRVVKVVEGGCPTPGVPLRRVCGQLPAAGHDATAGSAVTLDISAR